MIVKKIVPDANAMNWLDHWHGENRCYALRGATGLALEEPWGCLGYCTDKGCIFNGTLFNNVYLPTRLNSKLN